MESAVAAAVAAKQKEIEKIRTQPIPWNNSDRNNTTLQITINLHKIVFEPTVKL